MTQRPFIGVAQAATRSGTEGLGDLDCGVQAVRRRAGGPSPWAGAALHDNVRHQAVVVPGGIAGRLDAADLVADDVARLDMGMAMPADVRPLAVEHLECDESVLSGEPAAATKTTDPTKAGAPLGHLRCHALIGTIVQAGSGLGIVPPDPASRSGRPRPPPTAASTAELPGSLAQPGHGSASMTVNTATDPAALTLPRHIAVRERNKYENGSVGGVPGHDVLPVPTIHHALPKAAHFDLARRPRTVPDTLAR